MTALLVGAFLLRVSTAQPAAAWKVDKQVLRRLEEVCAMEAERPEQDWARRETVDGLGEPGRQALLFMAEGGKKVSVWNQRCAVLLLDQLGERRMVPILRQIIADERADPDLRSAATYWLKKVRDLDSLPAMIAIVARHDPADGAYVWAMAALSEFNDDRARAALRSVGARAV